MPRSVQPKGTPSTPRPEIHTSEYQSGDVGIRLSYPTSTPGKTRAVLTVRDLASGQTLCEAELTPEALMVLLSNGEAQVSHALLPRHPERIGKRRQSTSVTIGYTQDHADDLDEAARRAAAQYEADGWEATRIDRTNSGRQVVAYRWVADA